MSTITKDQLIEDLKSSTQNSSGMFEIGEETICALMSLLTAPPAPVSVQDIAGKLLDILDRHTIEFGWEKPITLAELVTSRDGDEELNACRAAMLQGGDGNSPVIPDGWVMVPVEPTEDMIVNGFESEPD